MFLRSPELAGRVPYLGAFVLFESSLDIRVRALAVMTSRASWRMSIVGADRRRPPA